MPRGPLSACVTDRMALQCVFSHLCQAPIFSRNGSDRRHCEGIEPNAIAFRQKLDDRPTNAYAPQIGAMPLTPWLGETKPSCFITRYTTFSKIVMHSFKLEPTDPLLQPAAVFTAIGLKRLSSVRPILVKGGLEFRLPWGLCQL